MDSPLFSIPMGSVAEFDAAYKALAAQSAQLELAYCCGAVLMLEEAFGELAWVDSVHVYDDYEGGCSLGLTLRSPGGALCSDKAARHALREIDPSRPEPERHGGTLEDARAEELARAEFSFLTQAQVHDAVSRFEMAMDFFHTHAPSLFNERVAGSDSLDRADALALAARLGLPEVQAAIERSRLESSAARPSAENFAAPRL